MTPLEQVQSFLSTWSGDVTSRRLIYVSPDGARARAQLLSVTPEVAARTATALRVVDLTFGSGCLLATVVAALPAASTVVANDKNLATSEAASDATKAFVNVGLKAAAPSWQFFSDDVTALPITRAGEAGPSGQAADGDEAASPDSWYFEQYDVVLFDPQIRGANPECEFPADKLGVTFELIKRLASKTCVLLYCGKWDDAAPHLSGRVHRVLKLQPFSPRQKQLPRSSCVTPNSKECYAVLLKPAEQETTPDVPVAEFWWDEARGVLTTEAPVASGNQGAETLLGLTSQLNTALANLSAVFGPRNGTVSPANAREPEPAILLPSGPLLDPEGVYSKRVASIPLALLLKGVPGTGKSRVTDSLCAALLEDALFPQRDIDQVLRINVHSATSNGALMQGIGVRTNDSQQIEYREKRGLVLEHILNAVLNPGYPFILVLEEVQENSLNTLIGDLVYLLEASKRFDAPRLLSEGKISALTLAKRGDPYVAIREAVASARAKGEGVAYVMLPELIEQRAGRARLLVLPKNFYLFCTSNYRDDRRVMEDNLMRRIEVLEMYPDAGAISNEKVRDFFSEMNSRILRVTSSQSHPDRFLVGHANWLGVETEAQFAKALLKTLIEFKDIKELELEDVKRILGFRAALWPFGRPSYVKTATSFADLIARVQNWCGYQFVSRFSMPGSDSTDVPQIED